VTNAFGFLVAFLYPLIVLGLVARVIGRDLPAPTILSWIAVLVLLPYMGPALYLLFGEHRLAESRTRRGRLLLEPTTVWMQSLAARHPVSWGDKSETAVGLHRLAQAVKGYPATSGNELTLHSDAVQCLTALIREVDDAKESVHLLFFIWSDGGLADQLADALARAAQRGVVCRVLVDQVGSRSFLRGEAATRRRAAGVRVVASLPVSVWRVWTQRFDLRNHRKIAVFDGRVGYTGSLNVADPAHFKQGLKVGRWVDTMVRVEGPAVEALNLLFLRDWRLDTGEPVHELAASGSLAEQAARGEAAVQVLPSGPDMPQNGIHEVVLSLVHGARRKLTITTPYFVPSEPLLRALSCAALRGVDVTLVVPTRLDSKLAQFAGDSSFAALCWSGVRVARFDHGLLHAKTITVDDEISLIGTLNMDMRSFFLNFEISLLVYDRRFTAELQALQESYLAGCRVLALEQWERRSRLRRGAERVARVVGPLL
jgi:cardiolipin synthase